MDKQKWKSGIQSEIDFWERWLFIHSKKQLKKNKLKSYFAELIGDKKEINLADAGSGALSVIGYTWDTAKINLFPSDILADDYKKLYSKFKIQQIVSVEKQDMTNFTYNDNFFDIVHCKNALDHSLDPYKAIKEMTRICKPGGWIYFWHIAHVGKQSGYHNFHQWNIDGVKKDKIVSWGNLQKTCDDCVIWNKSEKFLLSECVKGFSTEVSNKLIKRRLIVISKFKKCLT